MSVIIKMSKILSRGTKPVLGHPKRLKSRTYIVRTEDLVSRYGGKTNITVLPGVGIGPEIMEKTLEVLKAAQAPLTYEILKMSESGEEEAAEKEFENIVTSIKRNRFALKANIEVKSRSPQVKSRNILLRKSLDLFVYVLQCKTFQTLPNRFGHFDVTVIRQNTEGEYLMLEHEPSPGTVENLKVVTTHSSEKTAKYAFDYAVKNNHKCVTVVHSMTFQRAAEGVFLEAALDVSKNYPEIRVEVMEVSLAANKVIMAPDKFDIIFASNLNGSILSNILIGMVGGAGLTAGSNFGDNNIAVFEPGARNKGSSIVGKGVASPIAMITAAINLLKHLSYNKTAELMHTSLYHTLMKDKIRTQDLGGTATTQDVTDRMIYHVKSLLNPGGHRGVVSTYEAFWKEYCKIPKNVDPER